MAFDRKEYYLNNKETIMERNKKGRERKCYSCGKKCYGYQCWTCHSKPKQRVTVMRNRQRKKTMGGKLQ